jgi:hypothetical protein
VTSDVTLLFCAFHDPSIIPSSSSAFLKEKLHSSCSQHQCVRLLIRALLGSGMRCCGIQLSILFTHLWHRGFAAALIFDLDNIVVYSSLLHGKRSQYCYLQHFHRGWNAGSAYGGQFYQVWFVQGDYILSPIQFCHQILLSTEQNI